MDVVPKSRAQGIRITFQLTSQQRAFYEALLIKSGELSSMYLGALHALDSENPERLPITAHCLRELMEKIPMYLRNSAEGQQKEKGITSLTEKVRALEQDWKKAQKSTARQSDDTWSGEIDNPLKAFLCKLANFFVKVAEENPARREQRASALQQLDPRAARLPGPIESLRVKEWETYYFYFQGVAHHLDISSEQELRNYLTLMETFLLSMLMPRTFEERKALDAIIQEGEEDA